MAHHKPRAIEQISVYPGQYKPLPWKENALHLQLKKQRKDQSLVPVLITELPDHYKIEIPAPGFNREDFFIYTKGLRLTIAAIHHTICKKENEWQHAHHVHPWCLQHVVTLPGNADTDFVTSAYQNGVLRICVFKNSHPVKHQACRIIVY